MQDLQLLHKHLEQVFGDHVALAPVEQAGLPVYLARAYELWRGVLVGQRVVFACARRTPTYPSPKRIEADARALQAAVDDGIVALVLPRIEGHVRRRLIRSRVPFVVPGRQLFLPTIGIDLQERELGPRHARLDQLEWAAQVTVLRHVLAGDVEDKPLRAVAELLGYSGMTLSNVQRQLAANSVADVVRRGRARTIRFGGTARDVWDTALPHLRSPVRSTTAIRLTATLPHALTAGLSALAQTTAIADAEVPTLAMGHQRAAHARREAAFEPCPDPDDADAHLEVWNYDPLVLAQGECVDPLSLYLSVRENPDARVERAAAEHLEHVRW